MKIVSAAPSNTEILYKLGKEDSIVATTSLCDYPEEAARKDSIGGWSKNADLEKVKSYSPDKVFTSDRLQDEFRKQLEDAGIETVHVSPESLEEVYESIKRIGEAVNEEERARKAVNKMKSGIESTDLQSTRIYCEEWSDPPMVSGNWIPDLIHRCNGQYFIEEGRSRKTDFNQLKNFDPEIIVLNVCGAGVKADREEVLGRDNWQGIEAVEKGNVFVIDDSLLNRPTTRLADGVKRIESIVEREL